MQGFSDSNNPAFPTTWTIDSISGPQEVVMRGLTKRELFAKDLLCALLSNSPQSPLHGCPEYIEPMHIQEMPRVALQYADALLLELSK